MNIPATQLVSSTTSSVVSSSSSSQHQDSPLSTTFLKANNVKFFISSPQQPSTKSSLIVNQTLMRSNINSQQKSPSPPPPPPTTSTTTTTQTLRTIKITKNLDESPPSPKQQQHDNNHESLNKIIRTQPNTVSNIISSMVSSQQPQIQNITKKSLNINTTKQSTAGFTITTVNNSNILNAINIASPTTLSTSYVASCSGSSQINLPTTTPITKCSQALAAATTSQNPSSSSTSSSSSSNSATTLGPSTTAKLILTGSVSALSSNGNNTNSLIIETKPINNNNNKTSTQKILVSTTPRFTTPNTHQTLSSTPINIKSLNSSKLNDTLNKSSIIIDTKRNTNLANFVKTVSPQQTNESTTNISHMQISQLLNQVPTQRLNNHILSQQPPTSPMKPNIIRKHKSSFDELSLKRELEIQNTEDKNENIVVQLKSLNNQSKKIVNISKCSPSTSSSASSSSSSSTTSIKTQPTILNIPQMTGNIIQTANLIDSRAISPPPPSTTQIESQNALLTNSARKRRKQEFKPNPIVSSLLVKNELKMNSDENNNNELNDDENDNLKQEHEVDDDDGCLEEEDEPPKKITKTEINSQIYELDDETVENLSKEFTYCDRYGIKWKSKKVITKPQDVQVSHLLKYYKSTWKSKQDHFLNYYDVKLKEEPKTLNDLLDEKESLKNLNEWKFHYVISQFKELINFENDSLNFINEIENLIKSNKNIKNDQKLNEALKANSQRHIYMNEQLNEAHLLVKNLIQHKHKYNEILNRNLNSSSSTTTTSKVIGSTSKVINNKTQNGGCKSKIPISKNNNSKINKKLTNLSNR